MSLALVSNKKCNIYPEFSKPLSTIKPIIIKGSNNHNLIAQTSATELAENYSTKAKEKELIKKQKIEDFQNKIKSRAKIIEQENRKIQKEISLQKLNEKTRFLNVSKDYAMRSLNSVKKKQTPPQEIQPNQQILEEIQLPLKAEVIYPTIKEESDDEFDESSLKSIEETIQSFQNMRERIKNYNFLSTDNKPTF